MHVCVVCTIKCLIDDLGFVEKVVKIVVVWNLKDEKRLKTEKRSESEKDVNSNR